MPILRLAIMLVIIALFVLLVIYLSTHNKTYLVYIKQILKYSSWFAIAFSLLYLIARVIRLPF